MRVERLVRLDMSQFDAGARDKILNGVRAPVNLGLMFRGIEHTPDVIGVTVRVEGDLLLLRTARIVVWVRVQVATLSVDMSDGDFGSNGDIYEIVSKGLRDKRIKN